MRLITIRRCAHPNVARQAAALPRQALGLPFPYPIAVDKTNVPMGKFKAPGDLPEPMA